ncbi:MAG: hypothetical protein A2268_09915 [Candidatus Raymondbacteria bacterium RifOxyA12_full_50_37]|uniref:Uncharacterized protein n=1 Tax=Candidatus Raymondbacteria bacterium RIFOXYD12_FULL_49_13 TaxID=1817890 RepID=A0A1F7F4B8_UNCRA|nr:MAG: hypothetical protein A2268_09915 [Candidatus Raymondbacteria bacterium RifOxyA12_full_50_37]OGJ93847.1 MAG: hypothetical protein A2248_06385 [Candidatus Raymondbacteria bacterium RIFOXYA2_FULL_49_16]OGJ97318.1 MAG: hypothetical protein A2487_16440 [Candidatus Raymondbacteria bacterium RifOxyC12_full_50_8]OGJ98285.1 MAG: hypothetical protein A2453_00785 [Candidatus Raymondbacteria bacterium RIFOXYC2_FULL_50_21]OGJ99555.1 MAG: hypothetical protein A2350_10050 [Candidatus Raymondbacteria b
MAKKKAYTTEQSYQELVYGKYIFALKIGALIIGIVFAAYLILNGLGRSLGEKKEFLTIEQFLQKDEKARAQYRVDVRNFLIGDVLKYRTDTVFIVVNDSAYLFPDDKGVYKLPEEHAIYDCKLYAIELMLKRSLVELKYPFVFTMTIHKNSLKSMDLSNFREIDSYFPLYITKKIADKYIIQQTLENGESIQRTVFLPDSIAGMFKELYQERFAQNLIEKYVGSGPAGAYKNLGISEFACLNDQEKMEQRRAFFVLTPDQRKTVRNVQIGVQSLYGVPALDEPSGPFFSSLLARKLHEGDITQILLPVFDMATFSLMYPMVRIVNAPFQQDPSTDNFQSLLFIALKSGIAPAQYGLMRKDCPKVLKNGMYADITEHIANWDQFKYFPKFVMSEISLNGDRYFGIPDRVINTDAVQYRRDWLEEPGIIEWFQKKGWIHPKDKRPYIPFDWSYDDFRTIVSLITKNDPTGKRKGMADAPSDFMYLFAYSLFHLVPEQLFKPNPTQKTTWVFFDDNPVFRNGLETINTMFWKEKSIRAGVEISYSAAQSDFLGGRSGICNTTCRSVLWNSLMNKYAYFGKEKSYGEVVGLTSYPGCGRFPNLTPADCNIIGFNSYLKPDQLQAAVEFMKDAYYGESFNNDLFFKVRENRTLGSESTIYRDALASPYKLDTSKIRVNFYDIFPANYIEFFDYIKESQYIPAEPKIENFGLYEPPKRELQDEVFKRMFQKVFMDSVVDYDRIIKETASYCNTVILNFKDDGMVEKLDAYYQAMLEYYKKHVPEYYPIYKERFEKHLKFW